MVTGKDDTGVIIALPFFAVYCLFFVVCVVPCPVDIHGDGTLDRKVGGSHHAIEFIFCCCLTTAHTDYRIEARLQSDAETLFAMRHGLLEGFDVNLVAQRIETSVIAKASEYLHRSSDGTIDGTVIDGIFLKAFHLDAFTHFQVVILAEDILIG